MLATVDQGQAENVAQNVNLAFCLPGISAEDRACLWGPSFDTPQEAFDALSAKLPAGATTLVIPEGPYVFTQVQPEAALVG